eukprot:comp17220_c1_seq1/m.16203 comp17220_c1_seq1/g.16203  ORF comp17220_c1_seq1/g.16203 comp17220_c1_seq1/m.16203 type:complete len:310 (-) comp17220_c1_seq1:213-1142(-)
MQAARSIFNVLIVGAGATGAAAAQKLKQLGASVLVVDKGRGVGGRLATRRVNDYGAADHGVQKVEMRSAKAREILSPFLRQWYGEYYMAPKGFSAVAKELLKETHVKTSVRIVALKRKEGWWQVGGDDGSNWSAEKVLLTCPVPQALTLLKENGITLNETTLSLLSQRKYEPCICAVVSLKTPPPTGLHLKTPTSPLRLIVNNAEKGIATNPLLTVHADAKWSADNWTRKEEELLEDVLGVTLSQLGMNKEAVAGAQLKKWLYAFPEKTTDDGVVELGDGLFLAGDAFSGPVGVEGAVLSGLAAAERLA